MKKNKILSSVLALSCGILLGTGIVAYATMTKSGESANAKSGKNPNAKTDVMYSDPEMYQEVELYKPDYPVNEDGLTYGPDIPGKVITIEDEPDLQAVIGDNGVKGYCYKTDLLYDYIAHDAKTPAEAVKMQEEYIAAGRPPRVLNVYESDGKTIVDTFTLK